MRRSNLITYCFMTLLSVKQSVGLAVIALATGSGITVETNPSTGYFMVKVNDSWVVSAGGSSYALACGNAPAGATGSTYTCYAFNPTSCYSLNLDQNGGLVNGQSWQLVPNCGYSNSVPNSSWKVSAKAIWCGTDSATRIEASQNLMKNQLGDCGIAGLPTGFSLSNIEVQKSSDLGYYQVYKDGNKVVNVGGSSDALGCGNTQCPNSNVAVTCYAINQTSCYSLDINKDGSPGTWMPIANCGHGGTGSDGLQSSATGLWCLTDPTKRIVDTSLASSPVFTNPCNIATTTTTTVVNKPLIKILKFSTGGNNSYQIRAGETGKVTLNQDPAPAVGCKNITLASGPNRGLSGFTCYAFQSNGCVEYTVDANNSAEYPTKTIGTTDTNCAFGKQDATNKFNSLTTGYKAP